eukprot:TRINITY_DN9161_c1_g1_i2.p3 TRINITY_DN9161_c1_g1~~TRINITY_DN9161_c1_g1_i2.p3  ORF type:complete len:219 (-),score=29.02 TRINITY_DN9161_c1_g1_i2:367-1023(-)
MYGVGHAVYIVQVEDDEKNGIQKVAGIPDDEGMVCTIMVMNQKNQIVVGMTNNYVGVYDISKLGASDWCKSQSQKLHQRLFLMKGELLGSSFVNSNEKEILVYTHICFAHVNLELPVGTQVAVNDEEPSRKTLDGIRNRLQQSRSLYNRLRGNDKSKKSGCLLCDAPGKNGRRIMLENDALILYMVELKEGQVLIVEANWNQVQRNFPPPLYRHRYGT